MKGKMLNKNNSILFLVFILLVSLSLNVYNSVQNKKYGIIICNDIEEIRHRNETVLNILENSIKSGSITHEELLMLYKSYYVISDSFIGLWTSYASDKEEKLISLNNNSHKAVMTQPSNNDVYLRIENLIFEYLNMEMKNGAEKLVLDETKLENICAMKVLSKDIKNFYDNFNEGMLQNLDEKAKRKELMKRDCWKEFIENLNSVIQEYVNYQFKL